MILSELIAAVKNEGGFDTTTGAVSDATITSWLNDALRELVAESQYAKAAVSFGATVAGQNLYPVPANVVDVKQINVGGSPYFRAGASDLFEARAYGGSIVGGYGAFAPGYDEAGIQTIDLFPTPDTDGVEITALAAIQATVLSASTDSPQVPEEFHQALVDKAIGTGLHRIYERHDDAAPYDRAFSDPAGQGAVQKLRRRTNSRIGSGPMRIRMVR